LPLYIAKEIAKSEGQPLDFNKIESVKSGMKSGEKISDSDSRWVEKWFEIKC
jgi:hypothetical protein